MNIALQTRPPALSDYYSETNASGVTDVATMAFGLP